MNEGVEVKTEDTKDTDDKEDHQDTTSVQAPVVEEVFENGLTNSGVHVILSLPLSSQPTPVPSSCDPILTNQVEIVSNADTEETPDEQVNATVEVVPGPLDSSNMLVGVSNAASINSVMIAVPTSSPTLKGYTVKEENKVFSQQISGSACNTQDSTSTDNEENINVEEDSSTSAPVEVLPVNSDLIPITFTDDVAKAEIDGRQYLVVSDGSAPLGLSPLQSVIPEESEEPPVKRFKLQSEDGQSYILTLSGDLQPNNSGENQTSEHQYQAKQPELCDVDIKNMDKRNYQLLSADVSQAWFTTRDDKNILQSSGATWKQGQWTKDEVDLLQLNINEYCRQNSISDPTEIIFEMSKDERKEFYRTVAKGLQRPLFSVYRRVTRMYDQKNHMGKYSPEEISRLRELRRKHGNDWATIGQVMGRSASSVKDKCRLMKDTCNSGKWLPEEEKRLTQAVYDLTGCEIGSNVVHGLSWSRVAEKVLTRSEKQCRTKWLNYMNWKQQGGKVWTREDDMNLIYRITSLAVGDDTEIDWTDLATNWDSVRSPQWLRGKWWSLKRHIPDYQLLSFSDLLESMKKFYLHNVRAKTTILSSFKGRRLESGSEALAYVPISLNGDLSHEGSGLGEMDSGVQAYEVLQHLPNSSASYIITQPNGTDSLHSSLSEHIIVQTVPITQGGDADLDLQNRVVIRVPSSSDLNVTPLETTDLVTPIQLHGPMDENQTGFKMTELTEENGIAHSDSLSDDAAFHTDNLESSVISSPSDVIGIKQEPFVPSETSNGRLMTSFSDPMLNSNSNSLIGGTSTVETDKTNPEDIIGNM